MFRLKIIGLVLHPGKADILGDRGLGIETANVSDFSYNASGVDHANARDGSQRIRNNLHLLFNGLI